jgi:hypothetical protein
MRGNVSKREEERDKLIKYEIVCLTKYKFYFTLILYLNATGCVLLKTKA